MKNNITVQSGTIVVDVGKLAYGQHISAEEIAAAHGQSVDSDHHSFACMALALYIEQQSLQIDRPLIVKGERKGLRILDPVEASRYLWDRCQAHVRALTRTKKRFGRIDARKFDKKTAEEHRFRASAISQIEAAAVNEVAKLGPAVTPPLDAK